MRVEYEVNLDTCPQADYRLFALDFSLPVAPGS
jgi:hypothetical protein